MWTWMQNNSKLAPAATVPWLAQHSKTAATRVDHCCPQPHPAPSTAQDSRSSLLRLEAPSVPSTPAQPPKQLPYPHHSQLLLLLPCSVLKCPQIQGSHPYQRPYQHHSQLLLVLVLVLLLPGV